MQSYLYLSKSIYLEVAKLIIHLKNKTTSFFLYKSYRHWQAILFIPVIVDLGKKRKEASAKRVSRYRVYYLFNLLRVHSHDA